MRRSFPATARPQDRRGFFTRLQILTPIVTTVAFSLFSVGSVADVTTGDDRHEAPKVGSRSWLEQELANFRKYPFMERAERLIGSGQPVAAAKELTRILALDPDDVDARLRLIVLLLGPLDEPQAAAEHAAKLIEHGRERGLGYHYRALANLRLGDADSAAADWMRALETQELREDLQRAIRGQLADLAIQRGDFAAVPRLLTEDAADQSFEDRLRLVQAYIKLDRPKEATQLLMRVDGVPPEGWFPIAQYHVEMGQPTLAIVTINRGLERVESAPLRRELATSLGYLHMQRGEPQLGAQAFALAVEEGEPDPDLYLAWAQALSEAQLAAQALAAIESVEQTSPYGRRLHTYLLADLGRTEDAAGVLQRLLDDPSQQENRGAIALEIAELYAQAGDLEAQMTALEHAVALGPKHAPSLRALAERQVGADRLAAASDTLRALVAVEDQPENRLRLVEVLVASGEQKAALTELRQLVEKLPSGHPARIRVLRQWASLAEAQQQWGEAARAWEGLYVADSKRSPEYLLHAGRAARLGGNRLGARQILAKLDVDAQDPNIRALFYDEQAQLAEMEGEHMTAAQWQQQAVNAQPTAARHYHMAQVWKTLGDPELARRALEQAIILAPKNAEYHASLGYDYLEAGDDRRAAEYFETALSLDPDRLPLYEELGYVYRRLGRNEDEAELLGELIHRQAAGGQRRSALARGAGSNSESVMRFQLEQVQALRRAGKLDQALVALDSIDDLQIYGTKLKVELLKESGRSEDALQELSRLLDNPSQLEEPGAIALEIAEMHAQAGDRAAQLAALERAVVIAPDYPPALQALVERQVGAGDLLAAANTQRRLVALEGNTATRTRLVEILLAADENAAALVELRQLVEALLPDHPDLPKVMRQWANVAAAEGVLAAEARTWEALYQADETRPAELMLHAGRAARITGQHEKATRVLAQVPEDALTLSDQALLYEERALLASRDGDIQRAAEAQRRSLRAEPAAERHYRLAQYLLELGEQGDARSEFQQAVRLEPDNPEFQASLGYAYLRTGDDDLAAGHFQAALAADEQRLPLYEELGYTYRRLGQDEAAAKAFRQRIDLAQTWTGTAPDGSQGDGYQSQGSTSTGTDESGYAWRQEVQQLEDRLRINTGVFVRRMNGGDSDSDQDASVGLSGFQSQAGIDIAYRLDNVSDGRYAEVYGRSIWAFEDDTLSPVGSETQGGVGLRVKPFAPVNFLLSGERLVALGSEARNDWMVRASASFGRGLAYAPDQKYQHYRSVYLDAAKVVEDKAEFLVAEWREGVAMQIGQGLHLVPYGVAAASYTDDAETERRYEAGLGVALRGWFGGNAYHTHSSNFEVGVEFRGMVGGNTDEDSGLVVRLQYGF
ncbi:tetratricopeptide repeat protein [Pseudomonas sp. NyZ704]|nr:tetratricopeptide repeat protein [Pseudomonas sp. NyZ704]